MSVAERQLYGAQLFAGLDQRFDAILRWQRGHVLRNPTRVRTTRRDLPFGGEITHDAPSGGVNEQHTTGAEFATFHDIARIEVDDTNLGAGDHHSVRANLVATGAEPIPIKRHRNLHAVAVREGCRSIPRFDYALVILVERLHRRLDIGILLPRLRNEHHRRMHRRAPRAHQQLQRIVETRRVAATWTNRIAQTRALVPKLR